MLGVGGTQTLRLNMGINFSGGHVGVTEEQLHRAQVRPAFQQVRGKGMAQGVG